MDQLITWTITLYTRPFFCNPWEEEIWYQYLGKWNRILKDWDPVQGNFIRNGFPQKSNSAFIVTSLRLYDKHLYARLRLYFNDTLIKKKAKKELGIRTPLSPSNPCLPPPPQSPHPRLPAQHHLILCIFLLLSFMFFFFYEIPSMQIKYCCFYWIGLWQREQSGLSLRYQVARYNSSSKWEIEQLGGSLRSIFICIL